MNRQEVLRVNHSAFVTYVFPQKPLPKTLTFKDEGKMGELARRSETSAQPASPQTGFEEQDLPAPNEAAPVNVAASRFSMPCAEALRLKEEYGIALMRWGKSLFAPQLVWEAERVPLAALEARMHSPGCRPFHARW
jgi:hypothetical protein